MATLISEIETKVRLRLDEVTPRFWSSAEIVAIIIAGIKDLWRGISNLRQEHFLTIDTTNVSLVAGDTSLTGVPSDVHKVYMIEPLDGTTDSANFSLMFRPLDYNHPDFIAARCADAIDPVANTIYYAVIAAGSPVGSPTVKVAPATTADVDIAFAYIPTISSALTSASDVPIPGDVDNALIAWTVAYARAKERDDRAPDPSWLATYMTEKARIEGSLGTRQEQELVVADALFEDYTS